MLYKDACNRKSNQQNLGTIKCSNLCTEIVEYSSPDEVTRLEVLNNSKLLTLWRKRVEGILFRKQFTSFTFFQVAVCNLASIALNRYVKDQTFDFEQLKYVTKVIVRNLNKIIDVNFYPVPEVRFLCFNELKYTIMLVDVRTKSNRLHLISGKGFEHEAPSHWNWGSGSCGCLFANALSVWKSRGSGIEQKNFWNDIFCCIGRQLRTRREIRALWNVQRITSQQRGKYDKIYVSLSILSQTVLIIQLSNGSTKEPGFPCRYGITT